MALAASLAVCGAAAQHQAETFKATATATRGDARATAPVTITIERYSSPADRTALLDAVRTQGTSGARRVLSTLKDVGAIDIGGRRTAIKFAGARPAGSGRLVTILTAEPLLFLGAGLPAASPREGYEVAVAILDARDDGAGIGELAPAAKVGLDAEGALLIEDYGATVVWLQGLIRAR
ncbi:hypothetical protein D3C83_06870 [compost metagenome]